MQVILDLPDAIQINPKDLRTELAVSLFQQERITLGTASQLAGFNQLEFQQLLARRGICIHYDVDDLEQDLKSLREDGW